MNDKKKQQAERIQRYAHMIEQQTGKAVRPYRTDGYMNMMNRYGTSKDTTEHYKFAPEPDIPDDSLTLLYEGNGLFAKVIDAPAEEAIKHGFTLKDVSDQEVESFYQEALDELDWEEVAMTGIKWARLFGGAIAVMLINDGGGLEEPLNWKRIKSIDDIRVYDRSVIQPDYSTMFKYDPRDPFRTRGSRLGMPEFYHVNSRYGSFTVHESRCLVFQNGVLPENCSNTNYQLWGMPEYIRIHRAIRDSELAHGTAPKMLDRSVQPVYKMKDLSVLLATDEGESQVLKRLQVIDLARSFLSSLVIDSENEDYDFKSFQFTGVADVIDATCNYLSALTNIPQTILFGRSPAGMNSTGESDLENWYSYVQRIQKRMLKSNLRYLLSVIFQAGVRTGEVDEVPKIKIEFNPLKTMSDTEQAELDSKKAATALIKAQTVQIYRDMEVIDSTEIRRSLADSDEFDIDTILDEYESEEDLMAIYEQQEAENPGLIPGTEQAGVEPLGLPSGSAGHAPTAPKQMPTDVAVEEHETDPGTEGSAPANAPAATKLPQDMSEEEVKEISNQDEAPYGVGVLVVKDGKILCGFRHNDSGYGLICGPGGHGEKGETYEQSAIRETQEEFGITPKELIPVGIGPLEPESGLRSHIFLCTDFDGEVSCNDLEIVNPMFVTMEKLEMLEPSLFPPFADSLEILKDCLFNDNEDGGPGSGNFGHKGRKGKIGGSAPEGSSSTEGKTEKESTKPKPVKISEAILKNLEGEEGIVIHLKKGDEVFECPTDAPFIIDAMTGELFFKEEIDLGDYEIDEERSKNAANHVRFEEVCRDKITELDRLRKEIEEAYKTRKIPDDMDQKQIREQKLTEEIRKAAAEHFKTPDDCLTAGDAAMYVSSKGYFSSYGDDRFEDNPDQNNVGTFKGMDAPLARDTATAIDDLFSSYPQLKGKLGGIKTDKDSEGDYDKLSETAQAHSHYYHGVRIRAKSKHFMDSDIAFDVSVGHCPPGVSGVRYLIEHEYCHEIEHHLQYNGEKNIPSRILDAVSKKLNLSTDECRVSVSGYAANPGKNHDAEFLAEAWAEYRCSKTPRAVAKAVGEELERYIKGVK